MKPSSKRCITWPKAGVMSIAILDLMDQVNVLFIDVLFLDISRIQELQLSGRVFRYMPKRFKGKTCVTM